MKRLLALLIVFTFFADVFSQAPEKMSYQAVIRDNTDHLVTNHAIGMRISILQGSAGGTEVYTETQTPTTNANGLVTIEIGGGAGFNTIDWSAGPYFIKTETDPSGGTSYSITGTSELLNVPYALHAKTVESYTETQNLAAVLGIDNNANALQIKNLADPVDVQDAATKTYVDALLTRIEALEESVFVINGFTDTRDNNHYDIVKIGNQIWMAENLKYLPSVVGPGTGSTTIAYYYVYGYNGNTVADAKTTPSYSTYGVLYNWPAAMNGEASSTANPSGVKGVCPTGWHLPSDAEWTELTDYLGGESGAGGQLKETGITNWTSPNTGATNNTGFTARPGGQRRNAGTFNAKGTDGYWWSATEYSSTQAYDRYINYNLSNVIREYSVFPLGLSVRCVKD